MEVDALGTSTSKSRLKHTCERGHDRGDVYAPGNEIQLHKVLPDRRVVAVHEVRDGLNDSVLLIVSYLRHKSKVDECELAIRGPNQISLHMITMKTAFIRSSN